MDVLTYLLAAILGAVAPVVVLLKQRKQLQQQLDEQAELLDSRAREAEQRMAREAERQALTANRELESRLQKESKRIREELEQKDAERRLENEELKKRLDRREEALDRKFEQLDKRERDYQQERKEIQRDRDALEAQKDHYVALIESAHEKLQEVANLTENEARETLKASLMDEARKESARLLKQLEEETRNSAEKVAREYIISAIQRFAGEYVAEQTVSVVSLPSDDMKGRIIGREGRNIRALEAATGCDLIIDDTPEAVVISGFNPVRRQVARRALEELITDGRIHPARIEEVVKKVKKGIAQEIKEAGEQAIFDVGLHNVHPEIVKLLGTLKFRTSYTQNVLAHSVEVAFFAGIIADELGLDANMARRAALLHDIGKAVDHEVQGSHAAIGGQLAKKYKEHPLVVNAIAAHHFEVEPESIYGPLTNAADALSAARPGARRESMENYIRRLQDLEKVACDFNGVDKAYAIQAGRELRVMVSYDRVNDEGSILLAREIARKVEEELTYPGQIKITVIREMRATEIAH